MKKLWLASFLCLLLAGCDIRIDFTSAPPTQSALPTPLQPTDTLPIPTAAPAGPSIPAGWSTYRNEAAGFEISYPNSYSALDDANSLYGWTNGVVLLYNSGQSYDIAVQLWDSQQDYENALGGQMNNIVIHQAGSRFFTIMDVTQEPENAAIIATFRLIE